MPGPSIVLNGRLRPDGVIELDAAPKWLTGPVRVRVELLLDASETAERLPDALWEDQAIPAPVDLPLEGPTRAVTPEQISERLPDPFEPEGSDQ